ncbi:AbgT family transporter [Kistimonas asteriae]|uniref:AbgT family transporter n=1 Tax=Kistimonas asteriae TaxID=517724 RepID=UPI001BAA216F|nr:AbgT family transporter [Kistimonas asteriae]
MPTTPSDSGRGSPHHQPMIRASSLSLLERIGKKIPDPVIIFLGLYVLCLLASVSLAGRQFSTPSITGSDTIHSIRNMLELDNIRWIFDHALLQNWLTFGHGILGVILIVMMGVGIAEKSGLLTALIKKSGLHISEKWLPLLLVFFGIMSSIATDAGYLVLIPLAGLLYAGLGKNPIIGMAAAFAGVSAGFSANLIPATPIDVIIGANARIFAQAQNVPFARHDGQPLTPATMHYYFILVSTGVLSVAGAIVTARFVAPKLKDTPWSLPDDLKIDNFNLSDGEERGLKASFFGLVGALAFIAWLALYPLAPYTDASGNRIVPYLDNVILLITLVFTITGIVFGTASGKFHSVANVVQAMVKQMDAMGYILVLTFFCYNFLSLLSYSGMGTWITWLGASLLNSLGLQSFPVLLIIGFIITTAFINIFVGGLTSKWMLLGPIFVPMLYQVNNQMTPDIVAAAFRVADSSTNIITPMMTYAGVILAFIRKYSPEFSMGDLIGLMLPYSICFLTIWTLLLILFFELGIPLGF